MLEALDAPLPELEEEADADFVDPDDTLVELLVAVALGNWPGSHPRRINDARICRALDIESLAGLGTLRVLTHDAQQARMRAAKYVCRAQLHWHLWHYALSYD